MGAVPNPYSQLAAPSRASRHVLFRLITLAGLVAFVFFAVSPEDDVLQPDFARGRKFVQSSVLSSKGIRCSPLRGKSPSAILLGSPLAIPGTSVELGHGSLAASVPTVTVSSPSDRAPPSVHFA